MVKPSQADTADPHELYELSVQCAESEVDFVADTFRQLRGRDARILREDFCGTANVCCEWVKRDSRHQAIGIDLDPEVLNWGEAHNLSQLSAKQRSRVHLIQGNVLNVQTAPADIISAMNFSYWLLKERQQLLAYFKRVFQSLRPDGIFFLDAYGGYDSFREIEEKREIETDSGNFTYIWEQARFNPIDHHLLCHIHFEFADGSMLERAFSYDWRLWTLPEIQELLRQAGFKPSIYWQGWDEEGEPDGEFHPATEADADAGWICYIVAEKQTD